MRISDWSSDVCSSDLTVSEDGEIDASAILFGDNLLRSLGRDLGNDLTPMVGVNSGNLATLRGVGIELTGDGLLTIDSGKLAANLVDKLDKVRSVFEYGSETSSPRAEKSRVGKGGGERGRS